MENSQMCIEGRA